MDTLFIEPHVLVVASSSRFAGLPEVSLEQVVNEPFVARKAPDKWRDFWLATHARGGQPSVSEPKWPPWTNASKPLWVSEVLLSHRLPRSGSMTGRGCPDVNDQLAREFVETARTLAAFGGVPNLVDSRASGPRSSVRQFN